MELTKFINDLILFLEGLVFQFTIPGYVMLHLLKVKLSKLETLILSTGLGIVSITCLNFFFYYFKVKTLTEALPILFSLILIYFIYKRKIVLQPIKLSWSKFIPLFIICIGVVIQTSLIYHGVALSQTSEIRLNAIPDIMWNISLIRETSKNIPPIHPGYAPIIVNNYHYFTQLFDGILYRATNIPLLELYHLMFPILYSSMLGLSSYILGRKLFNNLVIQIFFILMVFFAGSFSYLLPFFLGENFSWTEHSFWVNQTISMLNNPPLSLSLSLFLLIIFSLYIYWIEKQRNLFYPLVIFCGTIIAFKVYIGVIILTTLGIMAVFDMIKKDFTSMRLFIFSAIIATVLFLLVAGMTSTSNLVYAPFWFLHTMVENPDRLNIGIWALKEQTYWAHNNVFAVTRLRILELIIFISGNLGIRIIGLFMIPLMIFKKVQRSKFNVFLFLSGMFGIIYPLFFIQRESVGNTIQFFYYSLIIGNIFTVTVVWLLFNKSKRLLIFSSLIVFLLAVPTSVKVIYDALSSPYNFVVTKDEVNALKYIKDHSSSKSIILLPLNDANNLRMYVSAISERNTFLSDRLMVQNTLKDFTIRQNEVNSFFHPIDNLEGLKFQEEFLNKTGVNYIYLTDKDQVLRKNILIPNEEVFKNNFVSIIKL